VFGHGETPAVLFGFSALPGSTRSHSGDGFVKRSG